MGSSDAVRCVARLMIGVWLLAAVQACSSDGAGSLATTDGGGSGGSTSSGGSSGGNGGATAAACTAEEVRTGEATYYTFADGGGNCSFDPTPNDLMVGAMNATDYLASGACGACATIQGPSGTVSVRIVDQCPECPRGNIDLSPQAFDRIAARNLGRVAITWKYVPCSAVATMGYRFKEGSSQWWTAVQVRDHLHRIAKFEYQKGGAFVEVPRQSYNYFVEAAGMGTGPYTFRITDIYGHAVTDTGITFAEAQVVRGSAQFPDCAE